MSEQAEARRDGAKLQKNSGRGKKQKGDAVQGDMLIDYKEYANSFSVSRNVWSKVCTDAATVNIHLAPVIKLVLGSGNMKTRLAIINWSYLMYLKDIEERYETMAGEE
jgi:hypothetical protein